MESPEFIHHIGRGTFSLSNFTIDLSFKLLQNSHWIGIVADIEDSLDIVLHLVSSGHTFPIQLSGILDDGRQVNASTLYLTKLQPTGSYYTSEFIVSKEISLGQREETPPIESRYPLTNYVEGDFSLIHDGWYINSIPCKSPETAKTIIKKWRYPTEGMTLQLRHENSTMDQHMDFTRVVMTLLSLASGTGVSCHRQFFTWANKELEIWGHMIGDEIGPGHIIPEFEAGRFLEQTLPAWQSLSKDQQKAIRLAINHINLSELGYLDERLFHIFQSWEFLAETWGMHGVLDDSVTCLRSQLQQTRKQWLKDHQDSDPNGFWGSRISSIFEWPKAIDAIEKLADHFGLNLKQVGLDLKLLKDARDDVAHSGKLSKELSKTGEQALTLLITSRYYLQLLLLRMLSYQGLVYHATNKSQTIKKIDQALITIYNQNVI